NAELKSFSKGVASITFKREETVETVFSEVVDNVETIEEAEKAVSENGGGDVNIDSVSEVDAELAEKASKIDVSEIPDTPVYNNFIYHIMVSPADDPLYSSSTTPSSGNYQWFLESINVEGAWNNGADGTGIKVAVIDSGIDTSNNDLNSGDHVIVKKVTGYSTGEDDNGHGTHCAGIVAALDNTLGGVGVAPNAQIISIKALDENGICSSSQFAEAMQIAIDQGANIASISIGGPGNDETLSQAVQNASSEGILVITAAGNDGNFIKFYPAAYDHVISVANYDRNNNLNASSNYGDWVDIAAPGTDILATIPDSETTLSRENKFENVVTDGCSYGNLSGTSMACPVVSGVAALVWSKNPTYTAEQVKNAILNTKNNTTYSYSGHSFTGGVNAAAAVTGSTVSTVTKPTITSTVVNKDTNSTKITKTGDSGTEIYYSLNNGTNTKIKSGWSCTYSEAGTYTIKSRAYKKGWTSEMATVSFTVRNAEAVTPEEDSSVNKTIVMVKGQKKNFTDLVSGTYAKYTSSNKSVASVNKKGVITGKGNGNTIITAYTKSGKIYSAAATIKVYCEKPTINKMTATYIDQKVSAADNLNNSTYSKPDRWVSSKPAVASVDSSTGIITAHKSGSSKITAYYGNVKVTSSIKVKVPKLNEKTAATILGGTVTRKVTNVTKGSSISWDYNNEYLSMTSSGTYGAKFTLIKYAADYPEVTVYINGQKVGAFDITLSKNPVIKMNKKIKSGKTKTVKLNNVKITKSNGINVVWSAGDNMSLVSSKGVTAKFKATGAAGSTGAVNCEIPGVWMSIGNIVIY
ncbi:MAG: S8 family serine peptidase, partial [Lachnospiraceae bacterium]|nr:S8 family serine peptidase [Lachnospiraceae bacterium]